MFNMDTKIVKINPESIDEKIMEEAGQIIKNGGLVAFPTETVYGLGANALDEEAALKIYSAKGRPSDNPLIAHISSIDMLDDLVEDISEDAKALMDSFWPGPMTLIFKKKNIVPDGTTGGLDTIAVRFPSNPIAKMLIDKSGVPIAAPSANISGRPSPTKGEHVIEDMNGRIDMIIDGGMVGMGIESTIVDCTGKPTILRPGFVTPKMVEDVIGTVDVDGGILAPPKKDFKPKAPGMKYKHYAPKGELTMVKGDIEKVSKKIAELVNGKRAAVITVDDHKKYYEGLGDDVLIVSLGKTMESVAHLLFATLRDFDEMGIEIIYSEVFEEKELGVAVMNRLNKAAGYSIIEV